MKLLLLSTLAEFGYPIFLQGSLNENEAYPDSFITYWTDDVLDGTHYDDDVKSFVWDFSVIFYSNDPELLQTKAEEIRLALKKVGFIPQGKGRDIPSDEPTHTGWAMDFYKVEYNGG